MDECIGTLTIGEPAAKSVRYIARAGSATLRLLVVHNDDALALRGLVIGDADVAVQLLLRNEKRKKQAVVSAGSCAV